MCIVCKICKLMAMEATVKLAVDSGSKTTCGRKKNHDIAKARSLGKGSMRKKRQGERVAGQQFGLPMQHVGVRTL